MREDASKDVMVQGPQGELHVDDGGAGGLPVMFVHSAAGSTAHWTAQLRHLRAHRRAAALDLRGHGRSSPPRNGDYRIQSLAADLEAALDALGLRRLVLVGHSLGGVVCTAFAGTHADRVAGLLLLDPAGDGRKLPRDVAASAMAGLRADPHAATAAYWTTILGPSSAEVRARLMQDLRATPAAAIVGPFEDLLSFDPVTPLVAYRGPRSIVMTAANESPGALHHQVPDVPVRTVPTGHWVQLDDPDGTNRLLDEFLGSLDTAAAPLTPA